MFIIRKCVRRFQLFSLALLIQVAVVAQDGNKTSDAFAEAKRLADSANTLSVEREAGQSAYFSDLLKRTNEYKFMHQQRSFTWQYYSGIIIFFLVIIIVITGIVLSYKQFRLNERLLALGESIGKKKNDIENVSKTSTATNQITEVFSTNTLELSKGGIKISTAVIGLIILTISIAFFFLYLKYVYPISFLE